MSSVRIAHGSLHHHGAGLLPDDLEGVDYLLLDGGPVVAPDEAGPEELLEEAIRRLAPTLYLNPELKVIASLAGRNPAAAVGRISAVLSETGNAGLPVGVVRGSDVLDRLEEFLAAGESLTSSLTGAKFTQVDQPPVVASLSLEGEPVAAATSQGGRVVLLGHADLDTTGHQIAGNLRGPGVKTPLSLKLATGARMQLLLSTTGSIDEEEARLLEQQWQSRLKSAGLVYQTAYCTPAQIAVDSASLDLLYVTYEGDRADSESAAARHLLQVIHTEHKAPPRFKVFMGPVAEPTFDTWPTSIPNDLVEWSVDVRPAKDWVE